MSSVPPVATHPRPVSRRTPSLPRRLAAAHVIAEHPVFPVLFLSVLLAAAAAIDRKSMNTMDFSPSLRRAPAGTNPGGALMLELSVRPWLYNLTQKYSKNITRLIDIPDQELQLIAAQGFEYVWMMGIWQLGPCGLNFDRTDPGLLSHYKGVLPDVQQSDIIGSPYAVLGYSLNTILGSDDDLQQLRQRLNALGVKLILDFVPNHSAVDCPHVRDNPEFYIRASPNAVPPYDPNRYLPSGIAYGGGQWRDTAQFNYWSKTLAAVRLQELLRVASFADGIRCDMAHLLLNDVFAQSWSDELRAWNYSRPQKEWWQVAIELVKQKYPNIVMLAETYDPYPAQLQQLGFDYTYDKGLYDRLGWNNLDQVRDWLWNHDLAYHTKSAHFVANHDEPRAAEFFGTWWRADAAALMMYTLPGLRFVWQGDSSGFRNRLDVHLRRQQAEAPVPDVQDFYKLLLRIVGADVFRLGQFEMRPMNNTAANSVWRLVAYSWRLGQERRLCVINFSDQQGEALIPLPDAEPQANGNDTVVVTDLLSGNAWDRSASEMRSKGLYVVVNSWWGQIFQY